MEVGKGKKKPQNNKKKVEITSQSEPSGPMCSRSCGTPLWYLLVMMAERQRDPTVGGKKCFSQKQDMWRATLQQLLEASGAMDACTVIPQVHSSTPPSALACLILYPIQYVCFAPISAPFFSHSITVFIFFPPNFAPLCRSLIAVPSIHQPLLSPVWPHVLLVYASPFLTYHQG